MQLGEFTRRARGSRLDKKAKYEAAFERARRDLKLPSGAAVPVRPSRPLTFIRSNADRPILTLFPSERRTSR
jgi:hypothetical protein